MLNPHGNHNASQDHARILLVEDDDGDAMLIESRLRADDETCEVWRARDGLNAIQILSNESHAPDFIILDLNMPGLNGHEMLASIRALPRFSATPVIILTTSSSAGDVRQAYEGRANAYVIKPVTLDGLEDVVGSIREFWTRTARLPERRFHA